MPVDSWKAEVKAHLGVLMFVDAERGNGVCPVLVLLVRPRPHLKTRIGGMPCPSQSRWAGALRAARHPGWILRGKGASVGKLVKQANQGEKMMFEKSHLIQNQARKDERRNKEQMGRRTARGSVSSVSPTAACGMSRPSASVKAGKARAGRVVPTDSKRARPSSVIYRSSPSV